MLTVDDIKKQHTTALKVDQIKNSQLFLIHYPQLVLAVSFNTLIAFNHDGIWHYCHEKSSNATTKHQYHLLDIIHVGHWYTRRALLNAALSEVLKNITL